MNRLLRFMIAVAVVSAALALPQSALRASAAEQVVTGELVVLEGSPHRFRIVEHPGTFRAPADVSLQSLDGRPVRVVMSNGTVESIREMQIPIHRVVSGFETVRGQLQVRDEAARTFTLAGGDTVYVAPRGVDLSGYADKWVQARLDLTGQVTELRIAPGPSAAVSAPAPGAAAAPAFGLACSYRGDMYADGATVCQAGVQFRCEQRAWRNVGTPCGAPAVTTARTCEFGGATVASGSSICRNGTRLRCADGEWLTTEIACR